jgi:TolA-binding protein
MRRKGTLVGRMPVVLSILLSLVALRAHDSRGDQTPAPKPTQDEILYRRALEIYRAGKFSEAAALLEEGLKRFP